VLKISISWRFSALSSSMRALFLSAAVLMSPAYAATVIVTVEPTDNPYLAGAPDGVTSVGDSAPAQSRPLRSPVLIRRRRSPFPRSVASIMRADSSRRVRTAAVSSP
jgi:hypothetical protein